MHLAVQDYRIRPGPDPGGNYRIRAGQGSCRVVLKQQFKRKVPLPEPGDAGEKRGRANISFHDAEESSGGENGPLITIYNKIYL